MMSLVVDAKVARRKSCIVHVALQLAFITEHITRANGEACMPPLPVLGDDGAGVCVGCLPTAPGAFPYMVALTTSFNPNGVHCGGTLVTSNVVLTSAHCIRWLLRVQVGRENLFEGPYQEFSVTHVRKHPGYDPLTEDLDVALLRLDRPVPNSKPATLLAASTTERLEELLQGRDLTVMGYGSTTAGGRLSKRLLAGVVQHVSRAECNEPSVYGGDITANMLCARGDGVDHCNGDSGGPLVLRDEQGSDFLVGVVSWGIGCARATHPGVYVDVSAVRSWVMAELRNQSSWPALQR